MTEATEKKRILLVDDEAIVTRTLKLYLESTGKYEVRAENDGAKALNTAHAFRPHLVFLDIVMPEVDGPEVASRIKEDPVLKDTPIVFLTALVRRKEVGQGGRDIGGFPFIAKPIDPDEVVACIEQHTAA